MWRKFRRHKAGVAGLAFIGAAAILILLAEFTAPYGENDTTPYTFAPPQAPRFVDAEQRFHLRPFVYDRQPKFELATGKTDWKVDTSKRYPIQLLVRGTPYRILFFRGDIHLFGAEGGPFFPLGTDDIGRDTLSRLLYGGRISLLIALLAAVISVGIGTAAGISSGYFGGRMDMVIQRVVELFLIIPNIPLGLALAAFLPPDLGPAVLIAGIALVLSLVSWANVARQVRGKTLAIRSAEFVDAAVAIGASTPRILFRHVLPPITSHLIVVATLSVPQAILAESGLSFLGFGVRPPMTSWGAMLRQAQNFQVVALYPWLMIPGLAIMLTVLALNFVGDGLRDAADPYTY